MLKACACAGEQGSRGAGEQGRVQCALFFPLCPSAPLPLCPSAPPPLCPSAPLHFKLVRNAGLEVAPIIF
ncbi:MAG: hypothetical protein V7L23_26970 [Nostoc sp.]|uniref:hypothetical protein n=1 Tax=Nostoc sp. TaxID=1180 RepID=UPI002FF38A26